jgi:ferredoxin-NADP reductase
MINCLFRFILYFCTNLFRINLNSLSEHKVKYIRHLTESAFVIRFERNHIQFQTGQFILLGLKGAVEQREYTIYSGENDDFQNKK